MKEENIAENKSQLVLGPYNFFGNDCCHLNSFELLDSNFHLCSYIVSFKSECKYLKGKYPPPSPCYGYLNAVAFNK